MEKWMLKNKKADFTSMMEKYEISEVIARLLTNRNLEREEDIRLYLKPDLIYLHNPKEMKDLVKACEIILDKIEKGLKIRIVGDYDVDGIASTYIFYTALLKCGAKVDYEIPDRIKDGYGINVDIIEKAYEEGIDTILTCDNGISAKEQIGRAKELGLTVIITDHHDIPFQLIENEKTYRIPEGDAIVNPKQEDCHYPFTALCGAGVAFKFVQVLFEYQGFDKKEMNQYMEIAAIATVCDVMDLVGENRVLVKNGLQLLKKTKNYGIKALFEKNNIVLEKLSSYHLGFIIGPCLNASGRLDTAKKGLELLLANSKEKADKLANELKELNEVRKSMTVEGFNRAVELVENSEMKEQKVLVVYLNDCHESLAGIIAGRLKEKYNKPAIVLTPAETVIKGSARSIEAYNIYEELTKCNDLLLKYGGHPMAAGLSLESNAIESLRKRLNANTLLTSEDLMPKVSIDILLPLGYLNEKLIEELEMLEPFGKGNLKPVFAEKELSVIRGTLIGKNANMLKLQVINQYGKWMEALYFGDAKSFLNDLYSIYGKEETDKIFQNRDNKVKLSVTYYPSINEYNGKRDIQIIIQNYMIIK